MDTQLIGTKIIETAVKATLATGRVENSDNGPLSLLLIAGPESGKTSMVVRKCKSTLSFSDITGRGIQETLKTAGEGVSHLIILDMVAIMAHKENVNKYTLAMLNSMTEEGMGAIAYPGKTETFPQSKKGLIACLTTDLVRDGRTWWNKSGFASRMLPVCFDHSPSLIIQIRQAITSGKFVSRPQSNELHLPDKSKLVVLPDMFAKQIELMATLKAGEFQEKGYRRLKQFRALLKGHALIRNPKKPMVGPEEIEFLTHLMPFISFDRPCNI